MTGLGRRRSPSAFWARPPCILSMDRLAAVGVSPLPPLHRTRHGSTALRPFLLSFTAGAELCRGDGLRPSCHPLTVWRILVLTGKQFLSARTHPSQVMPAARMAQKLALTDTLPSAHPPRCRETKFRPSPLRAPPLGYVTVFGAPPGLHVLHNASRRVPEGAGGGTRPASTAARGVSVANATAVGRTKGRQWKILATPAQPRRWG